MTISTVQFQRTPGDGGDAHRTGVSRRDVLAALLAGAAVAGMWGSASAAAALQAAGAPAAAANPGLNPDQMAVLAAVSEVILPATDTPGAIEAGVPQFIGALVAQWMTADEAAQFRAGLAALDASARERHQQGYAACTPQQGADLLQALRAASLYQGRTFSLVDRITDPKAPFYLRLRDLVVYAYFTSEAGTTRELRYLPVPGKFDANVDVKSWPYQTAI